MIWYEVRTGSGSDWVSLNEKTEGSNLKPKPKTQNPKPKTQNPKPKTQNPKPKTKPLATASGSDFIPTTASSESCEMKTLPEVGLRKIDLDYRSSRRTDEFGNEFRYKAKVRDAQDAQLGRWAWDVFLVLQP
jgi:hypothetical protein